MTQGIKCLIPHPTCRREQSPLTNKLGEQEGSVAAVEDAGHAVELAEEVLPEEADGDGGPDGGEEVDGDGAHRVVDLELLEDGEEEDGDDAADAADEEGVPGRDDGAAGRDAHQPAQHALDRVADVEVEVTRLPLVRQDHRQHQPDEAPSSTPAFPPSILSDGGMGWGWNRWSR